MKFIAIIKAKHKIKNLFKLLKNNNIDVLPIIVLEKTEAEVKFRLDNVEGKLLVSDKGFECYTLFDIYEHNKLIKCSYHYDPKPKKRFQGETPEFSRSGTVVPGPC